MSPEGVSVTGIPGGYEATWDEPEEPDYALTVIYDSAQSVTDVANATLRGEVSGTVFLRLGLEDAADLTVWVRHKDRSGNLGEPASAMVTTLPGGQDGQGVEYIFTSSTTRRQNHRRGQPAPGKHELR